MPGDKLEAAPTTDANQNGWGDGVHVTAETETVVNAEGNEVVNTFLRYGDDYINGGGGFKLTKVDDTAAHKTITFGFDYRFIYGADSRAQDKNMTIDKGNANQSFTIDNDVNANTIKIYGKTLNKGEWYRIEYTYTWNETNQNYDIKVFIDGVQVGTGTTVAKDGVLFFWEIRYGAAKDTDGDEVLDKGFSDYQFDMDNFTYTAE